MVHMPLTGKSGCDIYLGAGGKSVYKMTALPVDNLTQSYGAVCFKKPEMEDVTVNLPLYNGIKAVYIGISPKAKIASPTPYSLTKPIVYYGSSITQDALRDPATHTLQSSPAGWMLIISIWGFQAAQKENQRWQNILPNWK